MKSAWTWVDEVTCWFMLGMALVILLVLSGGVGFQLLGWPGMVIGPAFVIAMLRIVWLRDRVKGLEQKNKELWDWAERTRATLADAKRLLLKRVGDLQAEKGDKKE